MAQEIQLVVFKLAGAEYGLPIHQVQEINRLTDITKLPQTPWFMEGVINLRGKVIPVVDLRKRFGLSVTNTDETRIIIVDVEHHTVGVIVDDVAEVLRLSTDEIEPPPANFIMDDDYLQGLGNSKGLTRLMLG
jgi:purine-binding chemotaxis protein CheW